MQFTIDLPSVLTAEVRGHEVRLDLSKADAGVATEIVRRLALYGMRKFNDAATRGEVAPTGNEDKMREFKARCADNARAMIGDWLAGDFTKERDVDPVAKRAREIATSLVEAKFGKLGKDATDAEKAERRAVIGKAAAHDKVRARAQADLDAAKGLADII